jgi:hypothetical protein
MGIVQRSNYFYYSRYVTIMFKDAVIDACIESWAVVNVLFSFVINYIGRQTDRTLPKEAGFIINRL